MYGQRNGNAYQLSKPAPPTFVADYNTNAKASTFAGTPQPATMSDLRKLAGWVESIQLKVNSMAPAPRPSPPAPRPPAGKQAYYNPNSKQCVLGMAPSGSDTYSSMVACMVAHNPVV